MTALARDLFQALDTQLVAQCQAFEWICTVLRTQGETLDADDRLELWFALGRLARYPLARRTMATFCHLLQVPRMQRILEEHCLKGDPV